MECANCESRLSAYADGELEDPREVAGLEQHLASCERCRRKLALVRALRQAIGALPAESVSDGFVTAVDRRLAEERRRRPRPAHRRLSGRILVAATLAATLVFGVWTLAHRRPLASPVAPPTAGSAMAPEFALGLDCGLDLQPRRGEDERPCASAATCGSLQAAPGALTTAARRQPVCVKG